ncbi:MAG: hypothetical protein INR65_15815 [Gluconacetobacter diazotrophicus]|nr:hypothetical protein [Gluconacetobacter diazotrophicus]
MHFAFCILHSSAHAASLAPSAPGASPEGPDIRAIVPPQPYSLGGSLLWLAVAAISLLLAGLVAWYLLRQPKAPGLIGPRLSPRDAARQKLAALEQETDAMDARRFGAEVCDVLRVYIGDEYRMHPQRQTSPEFLAAVAASRVFSRNEHTLLGEFLDGCDLLKFARADATPAGKRALLAQAREFIDGRERAQGLQPPPLPPPAVPPPLPPAALPSPR